MATILPKIKFISNTDILFDIIVNPNNISRKKYTYSMGTPNTYMDTYRPKVHISTIYNGNYSDLVIVFNYEYNLIELAQSKSFLYLSDLLKLDMFELSLLVLNYKSI
jgi:hypothetical protein